MPSELQRAFRAFAGQQIHRLLRDMAVGSFEPFCRIYLSEHFRLPPSPMHQELWPLLDEAAHRQGPDQHGIRLAVAAPRGHAKSTLLSLALPLWAACAGLDNHILILSNTKDQAVEHAAQIRRELETNERLLRDFPGVAGTPKVPPWNREECITASGVRFVPLGTQSRIRGRRFGTSRPTLIIGDDLECELSVRSEDLRAALLEWFRSAVLQAGTVRTNIIAHGTLLHPDSLLSILCDPTRIAGWTAKRYSAVREWSPRTDLWERWRSIYAQREDWAGSAGPVAARAYFEPQREVMLAGTSVLWPEKESYYDLMEVRERDGLRAFSTEKQNEPYSPEDSLFCESDLRYWDDEFGSPEELISAIGSECLAYGACDPSLGRSGRRGDYTALLTILKHRRSGVHHVVQADIRRMRPDEIVDAAIASFHRFNHVRFGFECVQFQEVLAELLRKRSRAAGREMPIEPVMQDAPKLARLQRLQPLIASGGVRFSRRHTTLIDQLLKFPSGAHDDGPDALEMAVRVSELFASHGRPRFGMI